MFAADRGRASTSEPALDQTSKPGSILVADSALLQSVATNAGYVFNVGSQRGFQDQNYPGSDHVDGSMGPNVPAGEHELYVDGSVRWVPLSNINVRESRASVYFGE